MCAHYPRALFLLSVLLSLSFVACFGGHGGHGGGGGGNGGGGGGNGGGGGGSTPGTVSIIEPTVSGAQVVAGSTLDFEAKVKGGNGLGVTWGVQSGDTCTNNNFMSSLGVVGGAGNVGTMPASTPNQTVATYTAPSSLSGNAFITVTITALQSPETTGPCLVVFVLPTKNALFSFNYVFRLKGFSNSSGLPFGIVGRFFADGNGHITSGLEDVNIAQTGGSSVAFTKAAFTGTYNMDTSSHGTMTLTVNPAPWSGSPLANPPPTTMTFSFTLSVDGTFGGLIETDGNVSPNYAGSGDFQFQGNSVNFTTTNIVGSYLASLAGTAGVGPSAVSKGVIGRLDLIATPGSSTAGTFTGTSDDQSGLQPNQAWTGAYTIDDQANGHGTFAITGGSTHLVSFYIGGPKRFYALRMDPNLAGNEAILVGAVRFMSGAAQFNNTSLGSALFQLLGITDSHSANGPGHASVAVGVIVGGAQIQPPSMTNGFLQGIIDLNDGGSVPNSLPIAFNPNSPATFFVAANGRGTASIVLPGPSGPVTYHFIFYLRTQGVGYLLEQPASDGSNRGRSGVFFPQNVTFGPSDTLIASTEVATAASVNGLAVLPIAVSGSSGNFQNGTGYASVLGFPATSGVANGTFTATDANNRGTVAVTSNGGIAGSATAAFYVLTDDEAILVGIDATNAEPQIIVLTNTIPDI